MSYYPFSEGSVAVSDQMMANYYQIADGTQYPYSVAANNGFTLASATYNIGASATVFQDVHCVNLHINDSITSVDGSLWVLVAEETLTDTATSIEFSLTSGFDGDSAEMYKIYCHIIGVTGSTYFMLNGDSGTNYGFQALWGQSAAVAAIRDTSPAWVVGAFLGVAATARVNYSNSLVYAKTGSERFAITQLHGDSVWDYIYRSYVYSQIWSNTSSTITTMKFYLSTGHSFLTGTNIQIWGKV